jgi:hypothetical protein
MFVNILSDIISMRKFQFLQLNSNLVLASTDCDQIAPWPPVDLTGVPCCLSHLPK